MGLHEVYRFLAHVINPFTRLLVEKPFVHFHKSGSTKSHQGLHADKKMNLFTNLTIPSCTMVVVGVDDNNVFVPTYWLILYLSLTPIPVVEPLHINGSVGKGRETCV